MKYLCLICIDEKKMEAMGADVYGSVVRDCLDYEEELRSRGKLLAVEALEPSPTAATVRVREGTTSVTDGPFAETKEQLAGFFLVEARDLAEAVELASGLPQARFGSIEVRRIRDLAPYAAPSRPTRGVSARSTGAEAPAA